MCLLIETIKVSERRFHNLAFHNERMNASRALLFAAYNKLDIAKAVPIAPNLGMGIIKCTVEYSNNIGKATFTPYTMKKIERLKVVHCNTIKYEHKYAARDIFNRLFEQRAGCDEVLIVRNGLITDTSFSNIILYDGYKWITPKTPLLKGTKREKLLREGSLIEADIKLQNLKKFSKVSLINAMLEPGDITVDCGNILE